MARWPLPARPLAGGCSPGPSLGHPSRRVKERVATIVLRICTKPTLKRAGQPGQKRVLVVAESPIDGLSATTLLYPDYRTTMAATD